MVSEEIQEIHSDISNFQMIGPDTNRLLTIIDKLTIKVGQLERQLSETQASLEELWGTHGRK